MGILSIRKPLASMDLPLFTIIYPFHITLWISKIVLWSPTAGTIPSFLPVTPPASFPPSYYCLRFTFTLHSGLSALSSSQDGQPSVPVVRLLQHPPHSENVPPGYNHRANPAAEKSKSQYHQTFAKAAVYYEGIFGQVGWKRYHACHSLGAHTLNSRSVCFWWSSMWWNRYSIAWGGNRKKMEA